MEFGRRSFVLFTCDPLTGARDRVLVAGLGIGEGVVQEKVQVDHYFVSRRGNAVRSVLTHKAQLMEEPRPAHRRSAYAPAPDELRDALPDGRADPAVVAVGDRIEELFGCPQDIEGTFTADGRLHILQSRPMVLDWPAAAVDQHQRHRVLPGRHHGADLHLRPALLPETSTTSTGCSACPARSSTGTRVNCAA